MNTSPKLRTKTVVAFIFLVVSIFLLGSLACGKRSDTPNVDPSDVPPGTPTPLTGPMSSPSPGVSGLLQVSFVDVGQGDSVYLHVSDGTDVLIDGGPRSAGPTVVAHLQNEGTDDIEVLILTHDDVEHVGGLIDVLRSDLPVESVIYPNICGYPVSLCTSPAFQEIMAELQKRGLTPTPITAPKTYTWGSVNASILNPLPMPTEHPDENSVVLLVVYGDVRFLLTADIGTHTERILMNYETTGLLLPADILKVAQHGGKSSSSAAFLEVVGAKVAVISVGATNPNGDPAQETLDRLEAAGARVLRTDQHGTIMITTDGETFEIYPNFVVVSPLVMRQAAPAATPTGTPSSPRP